MLSKEEIYMQYKDKVFGYVKNHVNSIEDAEDIIYNQDLDDMSDVLIKLLKDAKQESESTKRSK